MAAKPVRAQLADLNTAAKTVEAARSRHNEALDREAAAIAAAKESKYELAIAMRELLKLVTPAGAASLLGVSEKEIRATTRSRRPADAKKTQKEN